jgi:hypothetical protein
VDVKSLTRVNPLQSDLPARPPLLREERPLSFPTRETRLEDGFRAAVTQPSRLSRVISGTKGDTVMGLIRKLIVFGAVRKIYRHISRRRRAWGNEPAGAAPSLAAHSKDGATDIASGQNRGATRAKSRF